MKRTLALEAVIRSDRIRLHQADAVMQIIQYCAK
jgi:hypothetical protein